MIKYTRIVLDSYLFYCHTGYKTRIYIHVLFSAIIKTHVIPIKGPDTGNPTDNIFTSYSEMFMYPVFIGSSNRNINRTFFDKIISTNKDCTERSQATPHNSFCGLFPTVIPSIRLTIPCTLHSISFLF